MLKAIYADVKARVKSSAGLSNVMSRPAGLKQGCIISPILFTLFLNDLQESMSIDSDLETTKLFVLLFADDLVIVSETITELQRLINKLAEYCDRLRLTINLLKTKIIVFRNGGPLRESERWEFKDSNLEVVTYYKYLGLLLSSRNSWFMCQKTLANQASKAWFAVKSKLSNFGDVKPDILAKIFDCKILPILLYGSELWFSHASPDIEIVHNKFCKFVPNILIQAPNGFVRSELGRYTIAPYKYSRAIKYWLRIIHLPDNRLPKLCYKLQTRWTETNTNSWEFQVRDVLFRTGFGDVWLNQGVERIEIFLKHFKTTLLDIDMQIQNSDIQGTDRLRTYKLLKTNFGCENYLFLVKNKMFRTALVRFRSSLLKRSSTEMYHSMKEYALYVTQTLKRNITFFWYVLV